MASIYGTQNQGRAIGDMIRYHRRTARLTQVQLAKLAGAGKSTVYDIEKGKQTVQLDKYLAILRVLNIEVSHHSPLMAEYEKSQNTAEQPSGG